jgi:hypothetical protein
VLTAVAAGDEAQVERSLFTLADGWNALNFTPGQRVELVARTISATGVR